MDGLSLNSLRMSPAVHPVPGNDRSEVASLPTSNGHPKTLITWLQLWFSDKATWEASPLHDTLFVSQGFPLSGGLQSISICRQLMLNYTVSSIYTILTFSWGKRTVSSRP